VIPKEIEGHDWGYAFQCVGPAEDDDTAYNSPSVSPALESTASADPFQRKDVVRVIAVRDGEHDERNWLGVFELLDGRFAFVSAGCDYTGWDCQSGGHGIVAHSLVHLCRVGIGEDDLEALGLDRLGRKVAP
jgi:hypothetical protein